MVSRNPPKVVSTEMKKEPLDKGNESKDVRSFSPASFLISLVDRFFPRKTYRATPPKTNIVFQSHPFSGANLLLVSGG